MTTDPTTPQDPFDSPSIHARFECPFGRVHDLALGWETELDERLWPNKPGIDYVDEEPDCDCLLPDDVVDQISHELNTRYLIALNRGYFLVH